MSRWTWQCALVIGETVAVVFEPHYVLDVLDLALEESCTVIEAVRVRLGACDLFENLADAGYHEHLVRSEDRLEAL